MTQPQRRTVPLERIVAKSDFQFRDAIDPDWVQYLADNWESVNSEHPIECVLTERTEPDTFDTFTQHRLQAARLLGLEQVTVLVHELLYEQAVELAARSNLDSGKPYTPAERVRAIKAILSVNPLASYDELARKSKSSTFVAKEIANQLDLERRNPVREGEKDTISATVLRVIGRSKLPEPVKDDLVAAARKGAWTKDATRFAVAQVADPDWPVEYRDALLAGETAPLMISKEELPTVRHVLGSVRSPAAARAGNVVLALHELYRWARVADQRLAEHGLPDLTDDELDALIAETVTVAETARALQQAAESARTAPRRG